LRAASACLGIVPGRDGSARTPRRCRCRESADSEIGTLRSTTSISMGRRRVDSIIVAALCSSEFPGAPVNGRAITLPTLCVPVRGFSARSHTAVSSQRESHLRAPASWNSSPPDVYLSGSQCERALRLGLYDLGAGGGLFAIRLRQWAPRLLVSSLGKTLLLKPGNAWGSQIPAISQCHGVSCLPRGVCRGRPCRSIFRAWRRRQVI